MYTDDWLKKAIEDASSIVGSQRKLADLLEVESPNLIKIKKGERPANWKVRAKLKTILGAGTARAYIEAAAEELAKSNSEDEKKAATELLAVLAALPDEKVERAMGIEPTS